MAFNNPGDRYFQIARNLDIFATLFKEVNAYYVDEVDPEEFIRTGIDAMLESLDPYTNYIPEEEIENFRTMTTGQYAGIGAMISRVNNKTIVVMPYEGFAAFESGLRIGDEILEVDGESIASKSVTEVSKMLKGHARTPVKVKIARFGIPEPITIEMQRQRITLKNVPYFGIMHGAVGYIKLENFTSNANKEVTSALIALKDQGAKSIILDLRGNPGGLLTEAINISNIFIERNKEVVATKGQLEDANKTYKTLNAPVDKDIPLVILTDGASASAAEIVSGVVQDYDRGLLVGRKTFGKGLVQTSRQLSYNAQIKITTAKYYIPSGRCIQAVDYSKKDENGNSRAIPDSLKLEYKTANGRVVFDGAGLDPDIRVTPSAIAPITLSLILNGLIFDYGTEYAFHTATIPSPDEFSLSEVEYSRFTTWLQDKDFDYKTNVERTIEDLREASKKEQYYDEISGQIAALEKKVYHNKNDDLIRFKDEIKAILEEEIVTRYYGEKGGIQLSFKYDEDLQAALNLLQDPQKYQQLLSRK